MFFLTVPLKTFKHFKHIKWINTLTSLEEGQLRWLLYIKAGVP